MLQHSKSSRSLYTAGAVRLLRRGVLHTPEQDAKDKQDIKQDLTD